MSGPGLAAMIIRDGVDYDSLDGEPVHMVFLIAAPNTEDNIHLEVLSRLSMLLMDDNFRANLMKASTVEEFLGYIDQAEKESLKRRRRKNRRKKRKRDIRFLQLRPVLPESHILIWRRKVLKTRQKRWDIRSRWRQTAPAETKMY